MVNECTSVFLNDHLCENGTILTWSIAWVDFIVLCIDYCHQNFLFQPVIV